MKYITFKEFCSLPLINSTKRENKILEVTHGGEIVSFVKAISGLIGILRIGDIDVMGCSTDYIYSKIQQAIHDLEWIRDRVSEVKGETILCDNCKSYDDLDDDNLCGNCRESSED